MEFVCSWCGKLISTKEVIIKSVDGSVGAVEFYHKNCYVAMVKQDG